MLPRPGLGGRPMFERVYPRKRASAPQVPGSVIVSVAVHIVAVGAASVSLPVYVNEQVTDGIVYFAPLPVRRAESAVERITYVDAPGAGDARAAEGTPTVFDDGPVAGKGQGGTGADDGTGTPGLGALAELPKINMDSIYFPDEVDNPAAYDPRSAAPAYPDSLQCSGIEGSVTVQSVVDTTGRAADSSFVIVGATLPKFAQAVRDALPRMLFRPAELTGMKIRQLVQQTFSFRLPAKPGALGDSTALRPPAAPVPPRA